MISTDRAWTLPVNVY